MNLLLFKLYSSISAVLYPSVYLPPNSSIRDFEIGTAENLVLGVVIGAISFHVILVRSKHSQAANLASLNPEKTKMNSSLTLQRALKGSFTEVSTEVVF